MRGDFARCSLPVHEIRAPVDPVGCMCIPLHVNAPLGCSYYFSYLSCKCNVIFLLHAMQQKPFVVFPDAQSHQPVLSQDSIQIN